MTSRPCLEFTGKWGTDAGCGMWDVGCRMRDAGCGMRDAGCGMQDAGCEMRDAGCGVWDGRWRETYFSDRWRIWTVSMNLLSFRPRIKRRSCRFCYRG